MSAIDYTAAGEWELHCDVHLNGEPIASADVQGATLSDAAYALETLLGRADVDGLPDCIEGGSQ